MSLQLPSERSFDCEFCQGVIKIPFDLAPTKAPCPYCGEEVLSPPVPKKEAPAASSPTAPDFGAAPKLVPEPPKPDFGATSVPKLIPIGGSPTSAAPASVPKSVPPPMTSAPSAGVVPKPPEVPSQPVVSSAVVKDADAKEKITPVVSTSPAEEKPLTSLKDDAVAPDSLVVGDARKKAKGEKVSKKKAKKPKKQKEPKAKGEGAKRKISPLIYFGAGLAAVLIGLVVLFLNNRPGSKPKPVVAVTDSLEAKRMKFLRDGWKEEATKIMNAFLSAETVEEKSKYVVGGESRIPEMTEFYRDREVADKDTPLQAFSHEDLVMEDKERGLFLMRYDRPAQFAMNEFFRPVAPLEVQYKTEAPDALLATAANLENFAMDPVRILAFFKSEGEELKLDWDVFVQTKHRLLKEFLETPSPGSRQIFRIRMHEDVPSVNEKSPAEVRHYRVIDPANDDDFAKIPAVVDSALGRHLSVLNWVGVENAKISSRGATVELAWSEDEEPRVYIKRLLCWEYLGLGGVMGNLRLNPDADTVNLGVDRIPDDG